MFDVLVSLSLLFNTPATSAGEKTAAASSKGTDKQKGKGQGKGVKKPTLGAASIWMDIDAIVPKSSILGLNKAKLELACETFLKSRNLAFESYDGIRGYFAQRPSVRVSMLLITADRPWELDFACLSKVLLPGRIGMVMVRAIYGCDKLIDALVDVCIFIRNSFLILLISDSSVLGRV